MSQSFESNPQYTDFECNMSIMHSRFSEIRKFYLGSENQGISGIPHDHAHPNVDHKERIALFHNGRIANQEDLKSDLSLNWPEQAALISMKKITDSQLITALIGCYMDSGLSLKEALKTVIEQKIIGTYRLAVMELNNPDAIYFIKNSGEFALGQGKQNDEIVVSSDASIFKAEDMANRFQHRMIPNNELLTVNKECKFEFEKISKKINVARNPKATFDYFMHEEIVESIDAVDQVTDFGGKIISNHQVILGGFERSKQELVLIQDLIISAKGSSLIYQAT